MDIKCSICKKTFSSKESLDRHKIIHSGKKDLKCTLCDYSTHRGDTLANHILTHSTKRLFKCQQPNCTSTFVTKDRLQRHQHMVHEKDNSISNLRPFTCSLCPYRARKKAGLKSHMERIHSSEKLLKCFQPNCNYSCKFKGELSEHMAIHSDERPFACSIPSCTHTSKTRSCLKKHEKTHNKENKNSYKCTLCPYSCSQSGALVQHVRTHTGERPYSCKNCPYQSTSLSTLKKHEKRHAADREFIKKRRTRRVPQPLFECPEMNCNFTSRQKCMLTKHMIAHSDERPFSCSFEECDYKSKTKGDLKKHEMIHAGENPFQCNFCPYSCYRQSNLVVHSRKHTKEKPYSCQKCNYQGMNFASLKSHMERRHWGLIGGSRSKGGVFSNEKQAAIDDFRNFKYIKCKVATCGYATQLHSTLAIHLNNIHNLPRIVLQAGDKVYN